MSELLLERIKAHLSSAVSHPAVPQELVLDAQVRLGFEIPKLLKDCYLLIGNGGFGPGYGLIGLEGGYASDFGTLVPTFEQLRFDQERVGMVWPNGMLPFCEWGCNIYSCVECLGDESFVYIFENFKLAQAGYDLREFFELWLNGIDVLACIQAKVHQRTTIINPFTGKRAIVRGKSDNP